MRIVEADLHVTENGEVTITPAESLYPGDYQVKLVFGDQEIKSQLTFNLPKPRIMGLKDKANTFRREDIYS